MIVRYVILATFVLVATGAAGPLEKPMTDLPTPDYHRDSADPAWLAYAAQFHGHLGPWAAAGLRVGMAGRRAVEAKGYFDLAVAVSGPLEKPPQSCFLDGLQVSTGATWGKRNIHWKAADIIVVQFKNTRSGKVMEVCPTPTLLGLVTSFKPSPEAGARDDHALEPIARRIATLPESQLVHVRPPSSKSDRSERGNSADVVR